MNIPLHVNAVPILAIPPARSVEVQANCRLKLHAELPEVGVENTGNNLSIAAIQIAPNGEKRVQIQ